MGKPRRTARDHRRRSHGQNFLVDRRVVDRFLAHAELSPADLVVEFGAGTGALTVALARHAGRVIAVERDGAWIGELRRRLAAEGLDDRVKIVRCDLRDFHAPRSPYRVVSNPPFGLTTALLGKLLDDPERGPQRADLLVQHEVARKRSAMPPTTLRSAAWAPWWTFQMGEPVGRHAFRPVPRVDAAWLTIRRRAIPVLPTRLAPGFADVLRNRWQ